MNDVLKDYRYALSVRALGLSSWALRALINDDLAFVGQIVEKTETELLGIPNFGQKSLDEIKRKLKTMGLHLNTLVADRPDNETFVTILKKCSVQAATHDEIPQRSVFAKNADVAEKATATVTVLHKESITGAFKHMGRLLSRVVERLPDKNFMVDLENLVQKYDNGRVFDNEI